MGLLRQHKLRPRHRGTCVRPPSLESEATLRELPSVLKIYHALNNIAGPRVSNDYKLKSKIEMKVYRKSKSSFEVYFKST